MVSALVDRFAAALADPQLAPVGERLDPAARRLVAPAADHQHVRQRQRALALDDPALPQLLSRTLVLLHHVDLLDEHSPADRQHAQHLAALAALPSGVASLMATMTVSPSEAYRLLAPPITRMHWTFLAPELSATSSIERGWIIARTRG